MPKEYFLTYRHVSGQVTQKRITELDLDEVSTSPYVAEVLAETVIDFDDWKGSLKAHNEKWLKKLGIIGCRVMTMRKE